MRVPYSDRSVLPCIRVSVRLFRKKWLSPFYSTYVWYIHQTCTNCSSWHDLLIPCGGLCPWPTFHAWVTLVRKKWLSLYYSTYECYIPQTCTNCSSWHDLLIPCGGFVSLTYISRLSDHGEEEVVKSILQYLLELHSPNLHQLLIMTWSIDATWWNVKIYQKSRNVHFLAVTMVTYIHSNQDLCFVFLCIQVYSWMRFTKIRAHIWKS